MKGKIRFSLVYRDMWRSSGKYQPRVDQLKEVAPHIIEMGCFEWIETNGGAFEQVQLMYGENPNTAVRAIMDDAGFDVPEINMDAYMNAKEQSKTLSTTLTTESKPKKPGKKIENK